MARLAAFRSQLGQVIWPPWGLFRYFVASFSLLVFASFLVPIFGPLGCLLGVPFGSLWVPKLPQVGSKMALETHFLLKVVSAKKQGKRNGF